MGYVQSCLPYLILPGPSHKQAIHTHPLPMQHVTYYYPPQEHLHENIAARLLWSLSDEWHGTHTLQDFMVLYILGCCQQALPRYFAAPSLSGILFMVPSCVTCMSSYTFLNLSMLFRSVTVSSEFAKSSIEGVNKLSGLRVDSNYPLKFLSPESRTKQG